MCLATVIEKPDDGERVICRNIASAQRTESGWSFTDLVGNRTLVDGDIASIDLSRNTIYVTPQTSPSQS